MEEYQKKFAKFLANSGALFFADNLTLKDGRPTPYFVNIGNVAQKTSLRKELAQAYASMIERNINEGMLIDIVFGPSYKASLFVGAKFFDGCNIYMVDDVGTSMQTKKDGLDKIASESKILGINSNVVGIGIAVDREQVGPVYDQGKIVLNAHGEDAIGNFVKDTRIPVNSIVGIKNTIDYLFKQNHPLIINGQKRIMDKTTYGNFLTYMKTYGANR